MHPARPASIFLVKPCYNPGTGSRACPWPACLAERRRHTDEYEEGNARQRQPFPHYEDFRRSCRDGTEYGREISSLSTRASISRSRDVPSVTGKVPGTREIRDSCSNV